MRDCFHYPHSAFKTADSASLKQAKPAPSNEETGSGLAEIRLARVKKLNEMRAVGVNPFEYTFLQSHKAAELQKIYSELPADQEDTTADVAVAGRIMVYLTPLNVFTMEKYV
jgi:lysyl-tRNA synthetase class II